MKKIVFLVLHLGRGGIERAIISQANMLSSLYNVEIISVYKLSDEPGFSIDEKISIKYLTNVIPNKKELKSAIKNKKFILFIKEIIKAFKILYLRKKLMVKEIKKLDESIVISSRFLLSKWLVKYNKNNIIKVGEEHESFTTAKYSKKVEKHYKKLDYLMPVSKYLFSHYSNLLKNSSCKCEYIPHCVEYNPVNRSSLQSKSICSIGRLSPEKGYLDLIDVVRLVFVKHPDWSLNIVGDGEEKESIINKIKEYNLEKNITMLGYGNNEMISKILSDTSIFVMASIYESFGIVLLEAGMFGIPSVVFSSATGFSEIITNNRNGFLIKDRNKEEMANKICSLIEDEKLRASLGKDAYNNAKKYSYDNIKAKWLYFIGSLTK